MNLYFLVEGRQTERKVYPAWLEFLLPHLSRVHSPSEAAGCHYYLVSAEGYPSIIGQHLENAIADYRDHGGYDHLVVVLDTDESDPDSRRDEVVAAAEGHGFPADGESLVVVTQHRCIETWMLGNRSAVPHQPQTPELQAFMSFYDVVNSDPEQMGRPPQARCAADYHFGYLRSALRERHLTYTKRSPGPTFERHYLDGLEARAGDGDISTFAAFLAFCGNVAESLSAE